VKKMLAVLALSVSVPMLAIRATTASAAIAPAALAPASNPVVPTVPSPAVLSSVTAAPVPADPVPAGPGPAQPDGFAGPFWRLETPVGGSASISNSHLFLGVPGGANHDPLLMPNQAVRVVQEIGNQDFDVSIKIDSPLFAADSDTSQGLMVLADNEDFVTFGLTTDGNNIGLSVHTVIRGVATTQLEDTDFSQYQNPMYLRLSRTGSAYVAQYSVDGVSWAQAASFTYLSGSTAIGPYASNYNENPAKAVPVVMSVNWFDVQQ
jgi:regulation of enolase protein 1 (concanavalin A-like superfamily)